MTARPVAKSELPRAISGDARRKKLPRLRDLDPTSLAAHFGVSRRTIVADLAEIDQRARDSK